MRDMIIVNTEKIAGREINEVLGLVRGNTIKAYGTAVKLK